MPGFKEGGAPKQNTTMQEKFVSNKGKPIIGQLESLVPGRNVEYIALQYLTDPEDIRRFFAERVEQYKEENPDSNNYEEAVRSSLAYIGGSGEQYKEGWERFSAVLGTEFEKAMKATGNLKMESK
jgi:hypothetical protein